MGELRMERHFAVPPEKVFAFVTETQNLIQWWGPEGMDVPEQELDLTRPGPWSVIFADPAGRGRYAMNGLVRAVDPPRVVEFTMNVPGTDPTVYSTVRFEIRPDGAGGCHFALIQTGITDEMIAMGQRGWAKTLDRLDRLINASS